MNEKDYANQPKIYRMVGIDTAMHLLRPGASWEISNTTFTRWDDPRYIFNTFTMEIQ